MHLRFDHANLTVRDIDAMIAFLQTAFPAFRIRGGNRSSDGSRWVHIGTEDTYIALNSAKPDAQGTWHPYSGEPGVNHLGYEVDDVQALRARLKAAGYRETTPANAHPHRTRIYFFDPEGNDWEFVQYHSEDPKERNDYVLSDQ